jgi:hypothetical protein
LKGVICSFQPSFIIPELNIIFKKNEDDISFKIKITKISQNNLDTFQSIPQNLEINETNEEIKLKVYEKLSTEEIQFISNYMSFFLMNLHLNLNFQSSLLGFYEEVNLTNFNFCIPNFAIISEYLKRNYFLISDHSFHSLTNEEKQILVCFKDTKKEEDNFFEIILFENRRIKNYLLKLTEFLLKYKNFTENILKNTFGCKEIGNENVNINGIQVKNINRMSILIILIFFTIPRSNIQGFFENTLKIIADEIRKEAKKPLMTPKERKLNDILNNSFGEINNSLCNILSLTNYPILLNKSIQIYQQDIESNINVSEDQRTFEFLSKKLYKNYLKIIKDKK